MINNPQGGIKTEPVGECCYCGGNIWPAQSINKAAKWNREKGCYDSSHTQCKPKPKLWDYRY